MYLNILLRILILVLFFGGFINNIFYDLTYNITPFIFDALLCCIIANCLFERHYFLDSLHLLIGIFFILFAIISLVLIFTNFEYKKESICGYRNNVVYMAMGIFLSFASTRIKTNTLLNFILLCGSILAAFGISQFIFRNTFPDSLLTLKGESSFSFRDTDIVRVNGLLGSTLGFSGLLIILFVLASVTLISSPKWSWRCFIETILISTANILTFSRSSISFMVIFFLFELFMFRKIKMIFFFTILILCIFCVLDKSIISSSFLFQRLTFSEETTIGSDIAREDMQNDGIAVISKHPWLGVGLGSQGHSADEGHAIVFDGYWLASALEFGLPILTLFISINILIFINILHIYLYANLTQNKMLAFSLLFILLYFYAASFVNSTFSARQNYTVVWLLYGILVCSVRQINPYIQEN